MVKRTKYQVFETTDLRNNTRSYKVYERGFARTRPPVAAGLTRERAEAMVRELEEETQERETKR